jgi:hypothetical protein
MHYRIIILTLLTIIFDSICYSLAYAQPSSTCKLPSTIIAKDPQNSWNILYQVLPMILDCQGRTLDALGEAHLTRQIPEYFSKHENTEKAIVILNNFLNNLDHDANYNDKLKRLIVQRDLWAVYEATRPGSSNNLVPLQAKLVQAISKLAIKKEEISSIPVRLYKNSSYSHKFDLQHPKEAFIPTDLLDDSGSWVSITYEHDQESVAPLHQNLVNGRSSFNIKISTPNNRQATLDYLNRLNSYSSPWILNPDILSPQGTRNSPVLWNSEIPQFPNGTQVALIRKMLAIASDGTLMATNIIESIQIRVFEDVEDLKTSYIPARKSKQHFYEFRLSRAKLFNNDDGFSFLEFQENIPQYSSTHQLKTSSSDSSTVEQTKAFHNRCNGCHQGVGILTMNSYLGSFQALSASYGSPMAFKMIRNIQETNAGNNDYWSLRWKEKEYNYGYLKSSLDRINLEH